MKAYEKLLEPITIGTHQWRNRMVKAPSSAMSWDPGQFCNERIIGLYDAISKGGASAIILGGMICDDPATLIDDADGGVYTVANPDACVPIKELARLCSETLSGGRARVVFDIPESALTYGYAPDVKMRLNADKMKALGWQPSIPLDEMLRRLAADIRSFSETN